MDDVEPQPRPASPTAQVGARRPVSQSGPSGRPALQITTRAAAEVQVARELCDRVAAAGERGLLLGLATGGTMVGVYREVVRIHREDGVSFRNVSTVNLDEYLDLGPDDPRSFASFMREHLFQHIDVDPARAFVPNGVRARRDPESVARQAEEHIAQAGGIDLQLLGIGRNGHLAFNEPGSSHSSRCRVVDLAEATREDAAGSFGGLDCVPRRAITLGLADVLDARRLRVLAFGASKAPALAAALQGPIGKASPASALRLHDDVRIWADADAAAGLGPEGRGTRAR